MCTVTQLILDLTSVPQKEAQDPDPQPHCNLQSLSLKQARDRESSNRTKRQRVCVRFSPHAKKSERDSC